MRAEVTLNYDADTAAAMLAALLTCPREQRLDTLAVVVKAFVESTPASADLRGETHTPAANSLCRVEYKPFQRFEPIARIVRCGLPAGHDGDHDELIDGELGSNPWPQDHPSGTFPPAADPLDEAIEAATTARLSHRLRVGPMPSVRWSCGCGVSGVGIAAADKHLDGAAVRAAALIIAAPIEAERDAARAAAVANVQKQADTIAALRARLADAELERDEARRALDQARDDHHLAAAELARLDAEADELSAEADEQLDTETALRARLADAERERDEARANADDLRARLADTLSKLLDAATPGGAP